MNRTRYWLESVLHLLFPHYCSGCGTDVLAHDRSLCISCMARLPFTGFERHADNPVERKFWGRLPLEAAYSLLYFTPGSLVQKIMHAIKYRGDRELALQLGQYMGQALLDGGRMTPGLLLPLPLHAARERQRGYNQSHLLCEGMSRVTGWPLQASAVQRIHATDSQTRKSRVERWKNMEGNFEIHDHEALRHQSIWLVDDVLTTGATLEACGQALLQVPGVKLSVATLAFAWR